jgi:hypothetical protein
MFPTERLNGQSGTLEERTALERRHPAAVNVAASSAPRAPRLVRRASCAAPRSREPSAGLRCSADRGETPPLQGAPAERPKMMQVHVERDAGDVDAEKLKRFRLDGRCVEVIENIDRWFGPHYAYFKVRGDDGNLYILRLDEARDAWELTMFKSPQAETFASVPVAGRPYGDGKQ